MFSSDPLQLLLRTLEIHEPLEEGDRAAIRALPTAVRMIEPQGYLVREGDHPDMCVVLLSGFAIRQKLTGDGARQIVSLHIAGEPLDFQNLYLEESDHSVQALTRAEVAFIPRTAVQELVATRPAVAGAILHFTLVEASIFREWVLNVGRRNAPARLAHFLCELAVRLEAQGLSARTRFDMPLTQEQLADISGLTPVHVNRTLMALQSEGLIARRGRRVEIPDWAALRDYGDFNERYLHLAPRHATGHAPRQRTIAGRDLHQSQT